MVYDDRPLYEQNKQTPKPQGQPNLYLYPSATHPSQTYSWYFREDEKRRKGLDNEIDHAEIRAAARGVKNKWYVRYQSDPKRFQPIVDGKAYDWNEIINYMVK